MKSFSVVQKGSKGTDVYILQTVLRVMGYVGKDGKPLDVNGTYNSNLEYAINSFQTTQRAYGNECGTKGKNDSCFGNQCWKTILGG